MMASLARPAESVTPRTCRAWLYKVPALPRSLTRASMNRVRSCGEKSQNQARTCPPSTAMSTNSVLPDSDIHARCPTPTISMYSQSKTPLRSAAYDTCLAGGSADWPIRRTPSGTMAGANPSPVV